MTVVLGAMFTIKKVFDDHAAKDGKDKDTLNKSELKSLFKEVFGASLDKPSDKETLDTMFSDLDANKDNRVDFPEFMALLVSLTMLCGCVQE